MKSTFCFTVLHFPNMYHPPLGLRTILNLYMTLFLSFSLHIFTSISLYLHLYIYIVKPLIQSICSSSSSCHLGGSMVEHLLPGGIQGVLPIGHQALLCHVDHLPGGCVHGNGSLVAQSSLLGLLLSLKRADQALTSYRIGMWKRIQSNLVSSMSNCIWTAFDFTLDFQWRSVRPKKVWTLRVGNEEQFVAVKNCFIKNNIAW